MLLLCGIKSLGKNVNHCTARKFYLQLQQIKKRNKAKVTRVRCRNISNSNFQKKEYTVTSEQINKIFNVDRLVFCSADSVDILMQSCSKYHKDIRSLQAELQYMNLSIQEKLMQYGLFSKPAQFSSNSTIYLGRNINRIAVIQEKLVLVPI